MLFVPSYLWQHSESKIVFNLFLSVCWQSVEMPNGDTKFCQIKITGICMHLSFWGNQLHEIQGERDSIQSFSSRIYFASWSSRHLHISPPLLPDHPKLSSHFSTVAQYCISYKKSGWRQAPQESLWQQRECFPVVSALWTLLLLKRQLFQQRFEPLFLPRKKIYLLLLTRKEKKTERATGGMIFLRVKVIVFH